VLFVQRNVAGSDKPLFSQFEAVLHHTYIALQFVAGLFDGWLLTGGKVLRSGDYIGTRQARNRRSRRIGWDRSAAARCAAQALFAL
jgi:hypothetical protein